VWGNNSRAFSLGWERGSKKKESDVPNQFRGSTLDREGTEYLIHGALDTDPNVHKVKKTTILLEKSNE